MEPDIDGQVTFFGRSDNIISVVPFTPAHDVIPEETRMEYQ